MHAPSAGPTPRQTAPSCPEVSLLRLVPMLALAACGPSGLVEPFTGHGEPSDFEEVGEAVEGRATGLPAAFDRHEVMKDEFFVDVDYVDERGLQAFFERSPYGRSWLASASIGGGSAARAIVDAARASGINPLVMVGRMQVEASLVSPTTRPDPWLVDRAFGCGCPDGRACDAQRLGLERQVACAAETLRRWFDVSARGQGNHARGRSSRTLDGYTVVPRGHATASLYAYTPWVLPGRGGNWLVWNVTRKFALHAETQGFAGPARRAEPQRALEVAWERGVDGVYTLRALAPADVARVEYAVDGHRLGEASRGRGDYALPYRFSQEGDGRRLEATGFDASGAPVAGGLGWIDVTAGTAVFIRQVDPGAYEIGLERPPASVTEIGVTADGHPVIDEETGVQFSPRRAVRARFETLGVRRLAIDAFDASGGRRGVFHRTVELR